MYFRDDENIEWDVIDWLPAEIVGVLQSCHWNGMIRFLLLLFIEMKKTVNRACTSQMPDAM